ncbi:MAG: carbohydrate kinase family protein [Saezia sp.]
MSALICGSLAFDMIANHEARFSDSILPDQLHNLNVSFFTPQLRYESGGCAGNIAYTLKAIGGEPKILATMGSDGKDYLKRLNLLGIDTSYIKSLENYLTAQCFIITDLDNNQINAFHPGAMNEAHTIEVPVSDKGINIGIISPDGRQAMVDHAMQMKKAGIPFIFDPGQGLPMFNGEELKQFISIATWIASNDYEAQMLSDRTGLSPEEISKQISGAFFITHGAKGSEIWEQGRRTKIDPVQAQSVVDPTGCGDAYRAGLLYGLARGWSAAKCAQFGSHLGAIKIASRGPQNHTIPAALLSQFTA